MLKLLLLFLKRTKIKYEILTMIMLVFYGGIDVSQIELLFSTTLLIIMLLIYYRFLSHMRNKVYFLYSSHTIRLLKRDVTKAIVSLALIIATFAYGINLFLFQNKYLSLSIFFSIIVFGVIGWYFPLNIEKKETHNPLVISTKEMLSVTIINIIINLFPILFLGIFIGQSSGDFLVTIGLLLFSLTLLFQLVTLPVEFNASNRAVAILENQQILTDDELGAAKKVLRAAALTYVAAAIASFLNILRLVLIFGGNRNN